MASNLTVGSSAGGSGEFPRLRAYYQDAPGNNNFSGGEIEEESSSEVVFEVNTNGGGGVHKYNPLGAIREEEGSVFSLDFHERGEEIVYVAVGKQAEEATSMDALKWALCNDVASLVFLIHVFPEIKYIPTPLGKLPIGQVNPEQKYNYIAQERSKRREFLQKFLNVCSASKVKVETILIESETEGKAILDLIPILNIRKLVLGATKSSVRRMRWSGKLGSGVADQIVRGAPEYCEVKIICEGKEMSELTTADQSSSSSPSSPLHQHNTGNDSAGCGCFKI